MHLTPRNKPRIHDTNANLHRYIKFLNPSKTKKKNTFRFSTSSLYVCLLAGFASKQHLSSLCFEFKLFSCFQFGFFVSPQAYFKLDPPVYLHGGQQVDSKFTSGVFKTSWRETRIWFLWMSVDWGYGHIFIRFLTEYNLSEEFYKHDHKSFPHGS